jgi:hypothetical protein
VVFSVVPEKGMANNCVLPLPPVPAAIFRVSPPSQSLEPVNHVPLLAVLIGGDGAGCVYGERDWLQLADVLSQIYLHQGWKLLLTTSRRTGGDAELILKNNISDEYIAEAVWWSENPRPVISHFLNQASAILVTEDSLTMIAESIYSRRPVFTFAPQNVQTNANDHAALMSYESAHLIRRIASDVLATDVINAFSSNTAMSQPQDFPDIPAMIRAAIKPFLSQRQES